MAEDYSFELGALQVGTLPGRDRDTIGLLVSERRFSSLFVENIAESIEKSRKLTSICL